MVINLQEKYEDLREELPVPIKCRCSQCKTEMITSLDASYIEDRDNRITLLRPSNCPECAKLDGLLVKVVGEIAADGKIYPKNKERRPK